MRRVIWSAEAKADYFQNIEFLLAKWTVKEAENFIGEVDFVLNILPTMPEIFPATGYKNIRKGIV